jgi:virulence-associated protein VagC
MEVAQGLGDHARGGVVVISPATEHMMSWFTFDPKVDFTHCMPMDQEI